LLAAMRARLGDDRLLFSREASTPCNRSARRQECRRLRDAVSGIDVQEKVLTIEQTDSCALGQPLGPQMVACELREPAPGPRIIRYPAVARH
jgi:hypothetical protein